VSEAHENTRIRQLTDAAAHWEHKYTNARQYNRNLEERNRALESALHQICAKSFELGIVQIAERGLGLTAPETPADAVDRISQEAVDNAKTYGWGTKGESDGL
jgi:hypothetical protein